MKIGRSCSLVLADAPARITSPPLFSRSISGWDEVRPWLVALLRRQRLLSPAPHTMLRIVFVAVDRTHGPVRAPAVPGILPALRYCGNVCTIGVQPGIKYTQPWSIRSDCWSTWGVPFVVPAAYVTKGCVLREVLSSPIGNIRLYSLMQRICARHPFFGYSGYLRNICENEAYYHIKYPKSGR